MIKKREKGVDYLLPSVRSPLLIRALAAAAAFSSAALACEAKDGPPSGANMVESHSVGRSDGLMREELQ